MSIFRNPEVKKTALILACTDAGIIITGFFVNQKTGIFAVSAAVIYNIVFVMYTISRYRKIAQLSRSIDSVLHGCENIDLSVYKEGELSILGAELEKMIITLRQSRDVLKDDKIKLHNFIADISHQLRTPLTSMNLVVTLLSDDISEERKTELLHQMKTSINRISWLIESLLRMSKLDAGMTKMNKAEVSVDELVKKAFEPLTVAFDVRGLKLESNVSGSFIGDMEWSAEAVGNILKNAMEHTPESGTVYINAKETAIYTEIVIRDTGFGFKKEDIPRIFERFYKGKNSTENSFGIGLSLARLIITMQNGTIRAENSAEGGAQFVIRFYKSIV